VTISKQTQTILLSRLSRRECRNRKMKIISMQCS
jgi:hypothetical protein